MSSPRDQALHLARLSTTYAAERLGPPSARRLQDAASLALVAYAVQLNFEQLRGSWKQPQMRTAPPVR